jgi:hypothetical protein
MRPAHLRWGNGRVLDPVQRLGRRPHAHARGMGGREAKTASATVAAMAMLPSAQLQAIASYTLRAM